MRKIAVALALATTALAGPTLARDKAWYAGLDAGAMIVNATNFDLTNAAGTFTSVDGMRNTYEIGYDLDGVVGYDFGAIRTEFELGYRNSNVKSIGVRGVIPAIQRPFNTIGVPATG
ncbi:MAG TPA: flagellar motor protein MotB, partial [Polymorphobacter sp.]|nr:flagellar motor protein MotB [Polymorphobacter sp.]